MRELSIGRQKPGREPDHVTLPGLVPVMRAINEEDNLVYLDLGDGEKHELDRDGPANVEYLG